MKKVQPYWIYEPTKTSDIEKKEEPSQLMPGGNPHWVDMVEVVRCKDCIHKLKNEHDDDYYCETMWIDFMVNGLTDNDYCSSGERREK